MKIRFMVFLALANFSLMAAPIDDLLELYNSEQQMRQIRSNLNKALIRQNPTLNSYQDVLQQWADSELQWEELKPQFAEVYLQHFSHEEIEQLLAFYSTPIGKKSQALNATLIREMAIASAVVAKDHHQELEKMLQQAIEQERTQQPPAQ